jgi:hypothetical protein
MPDGSKKNSRGSNADGVTSAPRVVQPAPVVEAKIEPPRVEEPVESIHVEPVLEPAPIEPARVEAPIQARVEPRPEPRAETVQVLERPTVIAEPEISRELEPEPTAPTAPRTIPAFVQDGPIHIADALTQAMPTALEFDALGKPPSPEESLFGARTYVQAVEPEPVNLEPPAIQMLEPPEPEPELEMQTPSNDDAPWLESVEVALDAGDVPFFEEGPPLELYDVAPGAARGSTPPASSAPAHSARLETPEISKPRNAPRAPSQASTDDAEAIPEIKSPAKLKAHPNYDHLAKLLTHRVREAGVIEGANKPATEPAGEAASETETLVATEETSTEEADA